MNSQKKTYLGKTGTNAFESRNMYQAALNFAVIGGGLCGLQSLFRVRVLARLILDKKSAATFSFTRLELFSQIVSTSSSYLCVDCGNHHKITYATS